MRRNRMSKEMIKWVKFAIGLEDKGLNFYRECLKKTHHPRAMELFDYLVRVETGHKKALENILDAVLERESIKGIVDDMVKVNIEAPIFDKGSLDKITKQTTELSAMFNKALEFEQIGMKFYGEQLEKETDPDVKRLLTKLKGDEVLHRKEIVDLGYFVFGVPPPDDMIPD